MARAAMKFPKPEPKKKGAKARADKKVADRVRLEVFDRDGGCRFPHGLPSTALQVSQLAVCEGPLEWAHLPDWRRSRTVNQDPEDRHTTAGSMVLCRRHHEMLDQGQLDIRPTATFGADSVIEWYLVLGDS